jgi:hypothetical protein
MKIFAHYDVLGNIHGLFSVDAREGVTAMISPPAGLLISEIETEGLGLTQDKLDTEKLNDIAKNYVIATPFPRQKLAKRKEPRGK